MNEGGRGAWHRSLQSTQRRVFKIQGEFPPSDPGGRLSPRGSYLGSAFGAAAFPGGASSPDEAGGGQRGSLRPGRRPPRPPRAAQPLSAPSCREAISRTSTARTSRPPTPPRQPLPAKSGSARPLTTRRLASRAPRRPSLLLGRARARARASPARPEIRSPGLACSRASEYLVDPQALKANRRVGPSGRERDRREVIKATIGAGPRVPATDRFAEVA